MFGLEILFFMGARPNWNPLLEQVGVARVLLGIERASAFVGGARVCLG